MKTNKTNKVNFTTKAAKNFKSVANREHKSLSSCLRTVRDLWTSSDLQKIAKKDGLNKSDLNIDYMKKWLDGSNFCKNGQLGRMVLTNKETKEREFVAWETWTPGRVIDYLRRASAAHCKSLGL